MSEQENTNARLATHVLPVMSYLVSVSPRTRWWYTYHTGLFHPVPTHTTSV